MTLNKGKPCPCPAPLRRRPLDTYTLGSGPTPRILKLMGGGGGKASKSRGQGIFPLSCRFKTTCFAKKWEAMAPPPLRWRRPCWWWKLNVLINYPERPRQGCQIEIYKNPASRPKKSQNATDFLKKSRDFFVMLWWRHLPQGRDFLCNEFSTSLSCATL